MAKLASPPTPEPPTSLFSPSGSVYQLVQRPVIPADLSLHLWALRMRGDGETLGSSLDRPAVVLAAPLGMILLGETPARDKDRTINLPLTSWPPLANQRSPWSRAAAQPLPDLFGVALLDVGALLDELGVPLQEVDAPAGRLLQVVELILSHTHTRTTTQHNTTQHNTWLLILVLVRSKLMVLPSAVCESPA